MKARTLWFAVLFFAATVLAIKTPKDAAPNFNATSLEGERFTNESVKGNVVLLQFWATWCKFCRRDQAAVDNIAKEFASQRLIVLAVNVNESKKKVEKYLEESPRACKVVLTEKTNLAAMFAATSFPLYVLIDRDGNIAGTQKGSEAKTRCGCYQGRAEVILTRPGVTIRVDSRHSPPAAR